jgi:hypothetical protein
MLTWPVGAIVNPPPATRLERLRFTEPLTVIAPAAARLEELTRSAVPSISNDPGADQLKLARSKSPAVPTTESVFSTG